MASTRSGAWGKIDGHLAICGSVGIYAFGLIGQQALAAQYPVTLVAFWQFFGAALVLWAVTIAFDGWHGFSLRQCIIPLLWGVMAPGISLIVNMIGSRQTDAVTMTLIWGLLPFVAPLLSPFLIGERLRVDVLIGATIAFAGVIIGTMSRQAQGWTTLEGALLCGLAVFLAGLGFVLGRWLNRNGGNWRRSAALQVSGAALVSLCFSVADLSGPPRATSDQMLIMLYLIFGMTVSNFLLFNFALARIPVAFVSIYTALGPAYGAAAAWMFLNETLRVEDFAMIGLVVSGVTIPSLVQLAARRRSGD